jgi:nucleotide-binding universal stress UspA family protein
MFRTALVALDLLDVLPIKRPLLQCLPDLTHWGIGKVVLAHVIHDSHGQSASAVYKKSCLDELEQCAKPLRECDIDVAVVVRDSSKPAEELLAVARENSADLIVIGSRSQDVITKLFLGRVARDVIRKTTLPLLLEWIEPSAARTDSGDELICTNTLRKLLLATDFSKHAGSAERVAIALASPGRRIDCMHAISGETQGRIPAWPIMVKAALQEIINKIQTAGAESKMIAIPGDAKKMIPQVAMDRDYSLIIVGKHGQNWIESMVIGSTAEKVCETAGRPVLLVP